ncbi:YkvA family protein [Haloplasma contractile]|nr:YkvA family protein [Haloplasma contractile]
MEESINKKKILKVFNKKRNKAGKLVRQKDQLKDYLTQTVKKADKNKSSLEKVWKDLQLFILLVKDWLTGSYKDISVGAIIAIVSSLIYFVSPLDVIPDFLFGTGFIDDGFLIGYVINQLTKEIDRYDEWRQIGTSEDAEPVTIDVELEEA